VQSAVRFFLLNHDFGESVTGRELVVSVKDVLPNLGGVYLAESPVLQTNIILVQ
jgi:hypothetical protein